MQQYAIPQAQFIGLLVTVTDTSGAESMQIEEACGQSQKVTLNVENQTVVDAKFKISVDEKFFPIDPNKPVAKRPQPEHSPSAFKVDKTLTVPQRSQKDLTVTYSPTHPGLYQATITLIDERVGTRQYQVSGIATLPKPYRQFRFNSQNQNPQEFLMDF